MNEVVAEKSFTLEDQRWFAELSGDWNPVHIDPIAARRSVVGQPVVHGVHLLLWAIDETTRSVPEPGVGSVRALFLKPAFLRERIALHGADGHFELHGPGGALATIQLERRGSPGTVTIDTPSSTPRRAPRNREFFEAEGASGTLPVYLDGAAVDARYPRLREALGPARVATLCATSRLVGMEFPGLRSLLCGLTMRSRSGGRAEFAYRVIGASRPQLPLRMEVQGPGLAGSVDALFRPPPAEQPGMEVVAGAIQPDALSGQRGLVVGGSRGLGEVTAKLLAAGGGEPFLTYHSGREDAERVAGEIRSWGGVCQLARLDVRAAGEFRAAAARRDITHLYYFATPPIGSVERRRFDPAVLARFEAVYVGGFRAVVEAVLSLAGGTLRVFYPSSVLVVGGSNSEYAQAKRAGELACDELVRAHNRLAILSPRLPRIHTDQTLSLLQGRGASALATLLPLVLQMHKLEPGRVQTF